MNMKSFISDLFLLLLVSMTATAADRVEIDSLKTDSEESVFTSENVHSDSLYTLIIRDSTESGRYYRRIHRYRKHWEALIPTQHIFQYAGNMGLFSVGFGWDYGKHRQWETDLLFGFLPKYHTTHNKLTTTLKQTYIPWSIYLQHGLMFDPLSCGIYFNTVYGHECWGRQPRRYPDKYYEALSTKVRINVFVGQRVGIYVPHNRRKYVKSISAFYEVSTCDLYLRAMFQDKEVTLWDIISLSLGLKFQVF